MGKCLCPVLPLSFSVCLSRLVLLFVALCFANFSPKLFWVDSKTHI